MGGGERGGEGKRGDGLLSEGRTKQRLKTQSGIKNLLPPGDGGHADSCCCSLRTIIIVRNIGRLLVFFSFSAHRRSVSALITEDIHHAVIKLFKCCCSLLLFFFGSLQMKVGASLSTKDNFAFRLNPAKKLWRYISSSPAPKAPGAAPPEGRLTV